MLVSHDLQLINQMSSRAIWLHGGTVQMDGEAKSVTRAYQQFVVHGMLSSGADSIRDGAPANVDLAVTQVPGIRKSRSRPSISM